METLVKISFAKFLCPKISELPKFFFTLQFQLNLISLRRSTICTIIEMSTKSNTPPHDKFESNMRRLKRFILFWNGSNNSEYRNRAKDK